MILTFRMNESLAMLRICVNSDHILRSAIESPTAICHVVRQHCVFSQQYSIRKSGCKLNAFLLPDP